MASTSGSFNNGLLPPRSTIHDLFRARHQAEADAEAQAQAQAQAQAAKTRSSSPATNKTPARRASARHKLTSHTKPRPSSSLSSSSSATNRLDRLDRKMIGTSTTQKRKAVAVTLHVDSDDSDIEILPSTLKATATSRVKRSKAMAIITKEASATEGKTKSSVRAESISIDLTIEDEGEVPSEQVSANVAPTELDANHDDDDGKGEAHQSRDAAEREQSFGQWNNDDGAHEGEQGLLWDQSDHDHDHEPHHRSETPSRAPQANHEMWGEERMLPDSDGDDVVFADEFDDQPITALGQQGSSKDLEPVDDHASSNHSTCPICSISLGSMSKNAREAHANTCLDECDSDSVSKPAGRGIFSSMFGKHSKPAPTSTKGKGKSVATATPASNGRRPLSSFMPSFSFSAASSTSSSGPGAPNAFTALMTGHAETKQWKLAEEADKQKGRLPKGEFKKVPFYKWVEGLQITVDAFRYNAIQGCKAYFLTHAHSDHYQNLSANWDHGPIYCSYTTANLIKLKLGVKDEYLKPLPLNETVKVHGIDVTLIDANHCPGSVLFLFEGPHTDPNSPYSKTPSRIFRYLHCGDFRAAPPHVLHPAVKNKRIDICYLDTTYLDSKYCFPAQELVIEACAQLVRERVLEGDEEALNRLAGEAEVGMRKGMKGWLRGRGVKKGEEEEEEEGKGGLGVGKVKNEEEDERVLRETEEEQVMMGEEAEMVKTEQGGGGEEVNEKEKLLDGVEKERKPKLEKEDSKKPKKEKLLVMVGTYSIGKERIVKGIAKALGTKIYCDERKSAILSAQDDPELHALMTSDPLEGQVHMCWLNSVNRDAMSDYHAQYSAKRMEGGYTQVIGLRPTGWTYKAEGSKGEKTPTIAKILERERLRKFSAAGMYPQRDSTSTFLGYGVPYSEHSSFYELTCFALSLNYVRMIPTVNVHTPASRKRMDDWMTRWKVEKKRRADARIPRLVEPRSENYW